MNRLDQTIKSMDLHFFATGQHGITLAMAAWLPCHPEQCMFLDVRTDEERLFARFGDALHIPLEQLPDRIDEVPRDKTVVVFCTSVVRASMAAFYLKAEGIASARTLLANSEDMMRLFTPAKILRRAEATGTHNQPCCI